MTRPSMIEAVRAKCRDCMCDYVDGRRDCEVPTCSLYYWQPYRELEPALTWVRKKREATPAQLEALRKARTLLPGAQGSSPSAAPETPGEAS